MNDQVAPSEASSSPKCEKFGGYPDVIFVFPTDGGATLRAEKLKIANASDVFKTQFSSPNWTTETIAITDIAFDIFKIMLKHIYKEDVSEYITDANYLDILYMSRKYFLHGLTAKVIRLLDPSLVKSEGRILIQYADIEAIYNFGDSGLQTLQHFMETFFRSKPTQAILYLDRFDTFEPHKRLLRTILESPVLKCTEFELYEAVLDLMTKKHKDEIVDEVKWRSELGSLIYLIRFPTMSFNELMKCAKSPSLLTGDQLIDLLLWAQDKTSSHTVLSFSAVMRHFSDLRVELKVN